PLLRARRRRTGGGADHGRGGTARPADDLLVLPRRADRPGAEGLKSAPQPPPHSDHGSGNVGRISNPAYSPSRGEGFSRRSRTRFSASFAVRLWISVRVPPQLNAWASAPPSHARPTYTSP